MKILLFLLLLYAAVKLTNPQCTTATVDMSLVQQSGDEGDSITLNFNLECPVTENIFSIDLSYSDKETEDTDDFSGLPTVNIPTGVTFFSTMLSLSDDNIVEIDERFCVVIDSVGSSATPSAGNLVILDTDTADLTTTVTIEDDDTATVSIFPDSQLNEGTGADNTATVTLGWSSFFEDPGFTVGLSYDLTSGSLENGDLTTGSVIYTLSLTGTSSIEIPIVIHEDAVVEDHEFLTISITDASEPSGFARSDAIFVDPASDTVVVTVWDDDTLSVSFTVDQSADEGSSVEVAFLFSNQVEDANIFSFSYSDISSDAEAGDYSLLGDLATTTIDVPTATSGLTYTISFIEDNKAEDDETVSLSLTGFFDGLVHRTGGGVITGGSKLTFAATIQDDDDAELNLIPTTSTLSEGMQYTQTITISAQVEDDGYSVTLNVIGDTAVGGSDFSPSGISSYAIPTCVDTFEVTVAIIDDDLVEDCESFSVSIIGTSIPVGFRAGILGIGTDSLASVTIEDNDTATIGIRSIGTFTEGASSTGTITLTVTGSFQDSGYTATVSLTDGDTDGASDYTGDSFEVTLSQAVSTTTVEIPIVNNNDFEDYETFTAAITGVSPPSTFKRGGSGDSVIISTQENNLPGEIEDDDTVSFSFSSITQTTNEGASVMVTICSDNMFEDTTYTLSIDYLSSELDTTGMFIDYVEVPTFVVPSATNKYSFSFTVSGDAWVEDDESVTLSFSSLIYPHKRSSGVFFNPVSSTSVITVDDDDTAVISMVSSALQITEEDSPDVTGTISLQIDAIVLIPGFSVTLTWIDDTAIDGTGVYDDYDEGLTAVAVATATNTQEISYVVVSNLIVEDHESFTVSLSTVSSPSLDRIDSPVVSISGASSTTVVTINDDDSATFCFDSVSTVIEGAAVNTISYTIDATLEDSFYVELTFSDGSATQADDYSNSVGERVDIPSMGTFVTTSSITLSTDDKIEDDETFSVSFGTPTVSGTFSRTIADAIVFTGGCNSLTVTIYDDDTATIEMDLRDIDVSEDNSNAIVNVDIYGGELCFEGYTATISYSDVTTDGSDYTASVAVSIPTYAGTSSQFTFLLPITDDDIVEDNELVKIILSSVGSPASVTRTSAVVITGVARDQTTTTTIMDDDTATLTVSSDMECASEGDSYGTITLTLDKQVQDTGFIFDLVYQDIDALATDDYHNTDTQGDVATLTSLFTFTFSLSTDDVVEFEQSLSLSLADAFEPSYYTRTDAIFLHATDRTATVTIKDDDTATVSLSSAKVTVSEGAGPAEVVVSWSNPIENPAQFSATLAYTDGTAVLSDDYTAGITTTALSIEPATDLTVTVDLTNDLVVEDHEDFTVQLTGVSDPLTTNSLEIDNTQDTTEVCIQDDDTATVAISISSSTVTEDDTTLTVTLDYTGGAIVDTGFSASIGYSGVAQSPSDYVEVTSHAIPTSTASSDFSLVIVEDQVVEDNELAILELLSIVHPFTTRTSGAVIVHPTPTSATQTVTILDDDTTTCSLSSTTLCVTENTDALATLSIECTHVVQDSSSFHIDLTYHDGTAVHSGDYTSTVDQVTIPGSASAVSFDVDIVADMVVEDTQSFEVRTNGGSLSLAERTDALVVTTSTTTVTIKDDDTVTCSLNTGTEMVTEGTDSAVAIEIGCNLELEEASFTADITYSTGKSATGGSDFGTTSTLVTLPLGTTLASFDVDIVNDIVVEDFEEFCVTLDNVRAPGFIRTDAINHADTTATVSITDEDTATCSIDQTPVCVTEGEDPTATVTIACDKVLENSGVSIEIVYNDEDAFNPDDYSGTVSMVTLGTGTSSTEFGIQIIDDQEIEDTESFEVLLFSIDETGGFARTDAVELGARTGTVSIKDTDSVTCSFATSDVSVDEFDGFLTVEVECNGPHDKDPVSFDIDYTDGTAFNPADYNALVTNINFPSATTSLSFSISIIADIVVENDHSFTISVTDVSLPADADANCITFSGSQVVTIIDDDTATCSFSPTQECTDEDVGLYHPTISCDKQIEDPGVTFDIDLADGTAEQPDDYSTGDSFVNFATLTNTLSFSVSIEDDELVEDEQSFSIGVSNINFPGGFANTFAVQFQGSQTVTIKDDDTTTCAFSPVDGCTDEDDNLYFATITCDLQIEESGVSFDIDLVDGTAEQPEDYSTEDSSVDFATMTNTLSFSVSIEDDLTVENEQSFSIGISNINFPGGFANTFAVQFQGSQTVTIKDDDTTTCAFSPSEECTDEDGGWYYPTITCNLQIEESGVSFDIGLTDGTAISPSDYEAGNTSVDLLTLTNTLTFSVSIENDELVENEQSFSIGVTNINFPGDFANTFAVQFQGSQTVTIKDDDTTTCAFSPSEECTDEDVGFYYPTITCNLQIEEPGVSFDIDLVDGTAEQPDDYSTGDSSVDIATLTNTLSFSVSIEDDLNVENHQYFSIGISNVNFPGGFSNTFAVQFQGSQTVTIKDDDTMSCSFDPTCVTGSEDTEVLFTVMCDAELDDPGINLQLNATNDSADSPSDYTPPTSSFPVPVGLTSFTITVDAADDANIEDEEQFFLDVAGITFDEGFSHTTDFTFTNSATGKITDNDVGTCTFSPSSTCLMEDDGFFTVDVTCSAITEVEGFEIGVQGVDVDATSPSDYSITSTAVSIPEFENNFSLLIMIVDDMVTEGNETFHVIFENVTVPEGFQGSNPYSLLGTTTFTFTIKESDDSPTTELVPTTDSLQTTEPSQPTTGASQQTTGSPQPTTDVDAGQSTKVASGEQTTQFTTGDPDTGDADQQRNIPFDVDPCLHNCTSENMECTVADDVAVCSCVTGYQLSSDNVCEDINECWSSPCNADQFEICINSDGSYSCQCQDGYGMSIRGTCEDIDECLASPCFGNQDCVNLDGNFRCVCKNGFQPTVDDICIDIDECSDAVDLCQSLDNTFCRNTLGNFTCSCIDGYVRSSTWACIPADECDPVFEDRCQFPEEFCYVDEDGENFCGCSPGNERASPSSQCANIDECADLPDVCSSIRNSHCVDEVPTLTEPDRRYICECDEGYREVVRGMCSKEIHLLISMVATEINKEPSLNLWSEDLKDKNSVRYQQLSMFYCSFFKDVVMSLPEVNQASCAGLVFTEDSSGIYSALNVTVLSIHDSILPGDVKAAILQDVTFEDQETYTWEKSNTDSISVKKTSLIVQLLEGFGCSGGFCQNGGTCLFNEATYRRTCRCPDEFEGELCQNKEIEDTDVKTIPEQGSVKNKGLLIGIGVAAALLIVVFVGLCCLLSRAQTKKEVRKGKATNEDIALGLYARPLNTRVPSVVRNPGAESQEYPDGTSDYDDYRMRRLEVSFMKMRNPRSNASSTVHESDSDDRDDDNASGSSPEFSLPYAADGSVNV